jgi:GTP-binding protein
LKIETGRFIRSAVAEADFVADGSPQIAFVGRSNVGKSSLLNRLLGRRSLARISSTPGRTRAINYFSINASFYFVDLPGFGYAKVGKQIRRDWAKLMDSYFHTHQDRTMVVQLVDAKVGATPLDCEAAQYFADLHIPTIVAATKIDKLPRSRRVRNLQAIRDSLELSASTPLIPFSSVDGEGVKELWKEVEVFLHGRPSLDRVTRGAS